MRKIKKIILHCSYTKPSMDIGASEIRDWHVNDNGWSDIGYHFVIRRSGTVEMGRPLSRKGAHTKGHNKNSIGICLVGGMGEFGKSETNFTMEQYKSMALLVEDLEFEYPNAIIHGHNEFSDKTCPTFYS